MKLVKPVRPLALIALATAVLGGTGCSSGKCNASSCQFGCCDVHGICQAGSTGALCGTGGAACTACQSGQTCQSGVCFGCGTCDGCCAGATCVSAASETSAQCGAGPDGGLAACVACDVDGGQACGAGGCVPATCTPNNCLGCCAGTTCIARVSETFNQCGISAAAGAACIQCGTGQSCVSGACSGGNHDAGPTDAGPPNVFCTPCSGETDAGADAGSQGGDAGNDAGSDAGSDGGSDAGVIVAGNVCCSQDSSGGTPPFQCSNACTVDNALTCGSPGDCPPTLPFCCADMVVDGGAVFPYCAFMSFGSTCAASCPVHLTLSCTDTQQVQFCRTLADCTDPSYSACCQLNPNIGDAGVVPLRLCVNSTLAKTLALQCF
jgi:hypothetical protein